MAATVGDWLGGAGLLWRQAMEDVNAALTSKPLDSRDVNDIPLRASVRNVERITNDVLWSLLCAKHTSLNLPVE